ncbi:MAG: FGGY family carbohydrate kinase [Candidatus Brocadiia bacterium]
MDELVLVADCGSTNITVTAVGPNGELVASASRANGPVAQAGHPEWRVWDVDAFWEKVCACSRVVTGEVGSDRIRAVVVTTMGADGAPVTAGGELTHPPICWQCPRTEPVAQRWSDEFGARRLFNITGYQVISFNTLFAISWLRQNAPEALDAADAWLMMPGLLNMRLCGEPSLDVTSASTMMLLDLQRGEWSDELLGELGLESSFFPDLAHPEDVIGTVTDEAAAQAGLPSGIPVVAGGHDTQFAPIGSGAGPAEAVLSTGTWEIAMLRTSQPVTSDYAFEQGVSTEIDAVPGLYDPQFLMMGSGALEWVREHFYGEFEDRSEAYGRMIADAADVGPGAGGVMMSPSFKPDTGPLRRYGTRGTILGLGVGTERGQVYRAALEGLCFQLREALRILREATGFEPERLRVVGGGSRNELWNRLRADICRMPVVVTERREATTVGAAIAARVGAGRFESLEQGERRVPTETSVVEPSDRADEYEELYRRYRSIGPALEDFYRG